MTALGGIIRAVGSGVADRPNIPSQEGTRSVTAGVG